jgi:hypothetical protein
VGKPLDVEGLGVGGAGGVGSTGVVLGGADVLAEGGVLSAGAGVCDDGSGGVDASGEGACCDGAGGAGRGDEGSCEADVVDGRGDGVLGEPVPGGVQGRSGPAGLPGIEPSGASGPTSDRVCSESPSPPVSFDASPSRPATRSSSRPAEPDVPHGPWWRSPRDARESSPEPVAWIAGTATALTVPSARIPTRVTGVMARA